MSGWDALLDEFQPPCMPLCSVAAPVTILTLPWAQLFVVGLFFIVMFLLSFDSSLSLELLRGSVLEQAE